MQQNIKRKQKATKQKILPKCARVVFNEILNGRI